MRLHYEEAGRGPAVVLIHGGGPGASGLSNFARNLPVFAEHFRTIVVDQPGYGKSDKPEVQGNYYRFGPYISPMYSPELYGSPQAWFGGNGPPSWFPAFLPFSAAMLILWAPGGFRFTCYYYRGAYYKAFWMDPVNCTV